jgi:hypothetical protein
MADGGQPEDKVRIEKQTDQHREDFLVKRKQAEMSDEVKL